MEIGRAGTYVVCVQILGELPADDQELRVLDDGAREVVVRVFILLLHHHALAGEDLDPLECGDRQDVDIVVAG